MALPGQILGIQGIGGSQNLLNLELLGMMEILMGITLLSELNQRNPQITQANPFGNALTQGSGLPAFVPSIAGGGSSQTLVCPSSNGGIQQIPPVGYLPFLWIQWHNTVSLWIRSNGTFSYCPKQRAISKWRPCCDQSK